MDITNSHPHRHTGYQCSISPDHHYIANAIENRLVIRRHANDLVIMHVYETTEPIDWVEWSPDSQYISTAHYKSAKIHVWSIADTQWHAEISDSMFGLRRIHWSPNSQCLVGCSDLHLRLTIWSLDDQEVKVIRHPKFPAGLGDDRALSVSPDQKYIAIVEIRDGKDHIGIYSPRFQLLSCFATDTHDLQGLCWSPDSRYLCVWDNCLYHKLVVYLPNGQQESVWEENEPGLGIKSVSWSPDNKLLAIGCYDQKIRLLNASSWTLISTLSHTEAVTLKQPSCVILKEFMLPKSVIPSLDTQVSFRVVSDRPHRIPLLRPDYNTHNPKTGTRYCQFSSDGKFLSSRHDSMPTTLWIWEIASLACVAIVEQQQAIHQAFWSPSLSHVLVMSCGNENLYLAELDSKQEFVVTPRRLVADFAIRKLKWSGDGKSLLVFDQSLFCLTTLHA